MTPEEERFLWKEAEKHIQFLNAEQTLVARQELDDYMKENRKLVEKWGSFSSPHATAEGSLLDWFFLVAVDALPNSIVLDGDIESEVTTFGDIVFSPDGKKIVMQSGETIRIWDAESGKELQKLKGLEGNLVGLLPGGKIVTESDKTIHIWDTESGKELQKLKELEGLSALYVLADEKKIVMQSGETIHIWDAESGKELQKLKGLEGNLVGLLPGGKIVTESGDAGGDKTFHIWDAKSGKELQKLGLKGSFGGFLSDGKKIVTGSDATNTIHIWDAESGKELQKFGLKGYFRGFLSDGKNIVTQRNKTIQIWDVESGEELQKLKGLKRDIYAISQDGKKIIVSGAGKTVQILTLP